MATQIPNFYTINGVIDTSKSVLENMNLIAEAAGCWMTYDITQGKWAVVINGTGSSVATFTDSNILGSLNVQSTSLTEVYNSVEMEFPHKDLQDEPDYVRLSIAAGNRYPNEPDNVLSLNSQLINNQAQAQSIAGRALKQSRVEKTINFQADYSYIGLKAGELISVTNSVYGFNSKLFRITSISEEDADDGNIIMNITAVEYDAGVYSTADLQITPRQRQTGITADYLNSAIIQSNGSNNINQIYEGVRYGNAADKFYETSKYAGLSTYDNEWQNNYSSNCATIYQNWINAGCPDQRNSISNIMTTANSIYGISATVSYNRNDGFNGTVNIIQSLPYGDITYNGVLRTAYWPHLVVLYYAPFLTVNGQVDTNTTPPYSNFIFQEAKQAFSTTQNIIMNAFNPDVGIYLVVMIPYADLTENGTYRNPTAIGTGTTSLFPSINSKVHTLLSTGEVIN